MRSLEFAPDKDISATALLPLLQLSGLTGLRFHSIGGAVAAVFVPVAQLTGLQQLSLSGLLQLDICHPAVLQLTGLTALTSLILQNVSNPWAYDIKVISNKVSDLLWRLQRPSLGMQVTAHRSLSAVLVKNITRIIDTVWECKASAMSTAGCASSMDLQDPAGRFECTC